MASKGAVHLAGRYVPAAEILAGRLVSIRVEQDTLMFFDPLTRELRTPPSPLTWDQARKMRGARPAGPPPRPSAEPVPARRGHHPGHPPSRSPPSGWRATPA
jgi:hypothetical protein